MKARHSFGELLARLRRQRGYPSARSFFLRCGGRRTLGLTYANYLNLERGQSLPRVSRLERLFGALGLPDGAPEEGELARAYFLSLGASERLLGLLAGRGVAPAPQTLSEEAALLAVQRRSVHVGVGGWALMARDPAAHALFRILGSTKGFVSIEELAQMARLELREARRALERLASFKLIKLAAGRASCPFAGRFIVGVPVSPSGAQIKAAVRRDVNRWVEEGQPVDVFNLTLRTTHATLGRYLRHLEQAVNLCAHYEDIAGGPGSAIYHVQARAVKLFG